MYLVQNHMMMTFVSNTLKKEKTRVEWAENQIRAKLTRTKTFTITLKFLQELG